ncbi:MAG: DNA primase [Persephonella sp.]|nr:MAG: DNA primase [Persephonella sp.]
MGISSETIEEVYRTANVYDVISDYLSLKRSGSNYLTLCPFHTEKTPSFVVSPAKNIWKCFGCGKAGDSIKFLMEYKGLSFSEAVVEIANKYGITVKYIGDTKEDLEKKNLFSVIQKVADFYRENLKKFKEAKSYLKERNIFSSTVETFFIGYSPYDIQKLIKFMESQGITIDELKKVGVLVQSLDGEIKDRFKGRVIFPIKDHLGRIVAFGGRIISPNISPKSPKYLNSPETKIYNKSKVLYGFFEAKDYLREKKYGIIVEGYFDLLSMYQIGFKNIVATLGTSLTEYHAKLLKKFVNKVILMFDNDKAGKEAVIRASKLLLSQDIDVYYSPLTEKDPDDLAKKGIKEVENQLNKSKDIFEFLLETLKEKNDIKEKQKITKIYLELASHIPDKTKIGFLIDRLSKETGINKRYLEISSKVSNKNRFKDKQKLELDKNLSHNEILVLKALLENRDEVLTKFKYFDKIESSEYFKSLLFSILNGQTEEEIFNKILSYEVSTNPEIALEILQRMYERWKEKEIELELIYNNKKEEERAIELINRLIQEKQKIK